MQTWWIPSALFYLQWVTFNFTLHSVSDPAQVFSGPPNHVQVLVETGILLCCDAQHMGCLNVMSCLAPNDACVYEHSKGAHVISSQTDTIQGPKLFCYTSPRNIVSPFPSLRLFEVWLTILQQNFALHLSHLKISCLPVPTDCTVGVCYFMLTPGRSSAYLWLSGLESSWFLILVSFGHKQLTSEVSNCKATYR